MKFQLLGFYRTVELSGLKLGMLFGIRCAVGTSDYLVMVTFQSSCMERMRVNVRVSTTTACATWRGWTGPWPASPSFSLPLAITISGLKHTNESSTFL